MLHLRDSATASTPGKSPSTCSSDPHPAVVDVPMTCSSGLLGRSATEAHRAAGTKLPSFSAASTHATVALRRAHGMLIDGRCGKERVSPMAVSWLGRASRSADGCQLGSNGSGRDPQSARKSRAAGHRPGWQETEASRSVMGGVRACGSMLVARAVGEAAADGGGSSDQIRHL